jgi:hypothetical protein
MPPGATIGPTELMAHKRPSNYDDIVLRNAGVCCVCKRRGIGINVHHIDGDHSNNDDGNLAVLCVQEHDAHHRPERYPALNHLDLSADAIRQHKTTWEEFVAEARQAAPRVLAVLNIYGTVDFIHSARLLFQWASGRVVFERLYHLLPDGPPEQWIDSFLDEVAWLGPHIKLTVIDKPLPVEFCPCCGKSLSNIVNPDRAAMLTAPDWDERSLCSIYINPDQATLAILIGYGDESVVSASMHKCGGTHLHLHAGALDERVPIRRHPSIRTQATCLISKFVSSWEPAHVLIGTGDPDQPTLIDDLTLPRVWER